MQLSYVIDLQLILTIKRFNGVALKDLAHALLK